jgi:hypothetical protein
MITTNIPIRLLSVSKNDLSLFEIYRQDLIKKTISPELKYVLQHILDLIKTASYSDYIKSYYWDKNESEFKFEKLKEISSNEIKSLLSSDGDLTFNIFNTLFYGVSPASALCKLYCFMHCAYKIDNFFISLMLNNDEIAGGFFSDDFLFSSCKSVTIYKGNQDVYESFYLNTEQVKSLQEKVSIFFKSDVKIDEKIKYQLNEILLEAINPQCGLIIQRSI